MELVNIKMTPRNNANPIVNRSTTSIKQVIEGVIHDTYDYILTSEAYESVQGTVVVDGDKEVNVPLKKHPVTRINIAEYGAVFNDPAFDNKPILENAMTELHANGGGDIFIPDNGELYTSENIRMKSNINIIASDINIKVEEPRAIIKLMPTVKDYWCIFHMDNEQNISVKNIGIDSNHVTRRARGNIGDLTIQPQIAVSLANNSKNIVIENCYIHSNGVWVISSHTGGVHPKNLVINNNKIKWTMGFATPDKPFVQGVTVDNTLVYFDAIGYEFIGNDVETDTGYANMTGVEAHGANGIVRHNVIRGVRTGIIPWNMVNDEMDIENNIIIEDNKFIDVLNGMDIGLSPSRNFNNLQIRRNEVILNPAAFAGATFSRGIIIGVWNATNGEISKDFAVEYNKISSRDFELNYTDPDVYYNFYGIGVGSGVYKNLNIRMNTIENMPSFGMVIQNEFQKSIKVESGLIEGNIIKNVAKSQKNRGSHAITAIHVAERIDTNTSGLTVGVNDITDNRSTTQTWYTKPTSMPTADRFKKQNVIETKLPPQGQIVYNSANGIVDFTQNVSNAYLQSMEVTLQANTAYILETNFPGEIWVTNSLYAPTQQKVISGVSTPITTIASGKFGIVARPQKDLEGTSYTNNATQLENKLYTFTIRKAT